ncbi:MAG TPA: rod-binding protein [Myxococcota bacterium]|nr:rod-binding protein [Myxococcota bacterium]
MSDEVSSVAGARAPAPLRRETTLADAARQFEAYLVGEMLNSATRSPLNSGLLDGGDAGRMYREMFHQEIARLIAQRGSFGIAAAVERSANRSIRADGPPMKRP